MLGEVSVCLVRRGRTGWARWLAGGLASLRQGKGGRVGKIGSEVGGAVTRSRPDT